MAPSKKHDGLTCMALTWLNNKITPRGMRAATEFSLAQGYVADAVALCRFQYRFFKRYCHYSKKEPQVAHAVIKAGKRQYELLSQVDNYFACLFEAKVTRADFLGTFGSSDNHQNRHHPIASLHWCVTQRKLIKAEELPEWWGLLEEYGVGLTEIRPPQINILTEDQFNEIGHRMVWTMQKRRNTTTCHNCGRWITKCYCGRCVIKNNIKSHRGD